MARPSGSAVPQSAAEAISESQMIGDVNLFISEAHDDEEEESTEAADASPKGKSWCAEVEVMIAGEAAASV